MKAEERLRVRVERMATEGEAVAHAEGSARVLFVPHGVPADVLEVEVVAAKSSFARARIIKLVSAGPERVKPLCPLHFAPDRPGPACGGCNWQQLDYPAQLRHKREIIADCVARIAKLKDVPVLDTLASPQAWGYRNKVLVPFGPPPPGASRPIAGFFAAGSHRIVDFAACPVQPELSVRIVLKVKELAAEFGWPIYDVPSHRGWLRHLFVRTNSEGKAVAALVTRTPEFPRQEEFVASMRAEFTELAGLHHNVQPFRTAVVLGETWRRLWGADVITEKIGGFTFSASPAAFLQVNTQAAELMYNEVLAFLREGGRRFDSALDLYCGVGTLSLWIARAVPRVLGVEENLAAVRNAWKNAEANRTSNVRFLAGRVESVLLKPSNIKSGVGGETAVVADPPRSGLSVPILRFLTANTFKRIIYVSCNPATFARDAGYLTHSGFALLKVRPVDLFPQTSHVELVGLFDRPH